MNYKENQNLSHNNNENDDNENVETENFAIQQGNLENRKPKREVELGQLGINIEPEKSSENNIDSDDTGINPSVNNGTYGYPVNTGNTGNTSDNDYGPQNTVYDSSNTVYDSSNSVGYDNSVYNGGNSYNSYENPYMNQNDFSQPYGRVSSSDSVSRNNNWPDFLIEDKNQVIFGGVSLLLSLVSGLGLFTGAFYLFYLDNKVEKDGLAKLLNGIAFALPVIGIVLSILMFLFFLGIGILF